MLRRRQPLDEAIAAHPRLAVLPARDRAFVRLLLATVLRRLGQIDAVIAARLDRPPKADLVVDILRIGAAQLLFLGTPAHAAVDTALRLCDGRRLGGFKGLVNAVLRRIAQHGPGLVAAQDAARLNTPDWLWQSWTGVYGPATARAIAEAHLVEAPLDITAKADPAEWAVRLDATLLPTGSLRRAAGGDVTALPGFAEGAWWVQDAAAALPARLLGDLRGRTAIDLCAAPGGKAAQMAAAGAELVAVDKSPARLERLRENFDRLRLAASVVAADALDWRPGQPAAAVLLDAPCSATGTIRRHPDVARLKGPDDVARHAALQGRLIAAAAEMTAPGGRLVYASCSLQPEEGEAVVAGLLARVPEMVREPVAPAEIGGLAELITPAGDLRTLPCHLRGGGGLDGFYAARLRRLG